MASGEARLVRRGRLQLIVALISLLLAILAAVVPAWIVGHTTFEPDGGGGWLERLLAVAFGTLSIVLGVLSYRTRRQLAGVRS
jgi:ABC-type sulfate transport system permease subunit